VLEPAGALTRPGCPHKGRCTRAAGAGVAAVAGQLRAAEAEAPTRRRLYRGRPGCLLASFTFGTSPLLSPSVVAAQAAVPSRVGPAEGPPHQAEATPDVALGRGPWPLVL